MKFIPFRRLPYAAFLLDFSNFASLYPFILFLCVHLNLYQHLSKTKEPVPGFVPDHKLSCLADLYFRSQFVHDFLGLFLCHMAVNIHCSLYIVVAHDFLYDLDIALILTEAGAEGMPEDVWGEVREQFRGTMLFLCPVRFLFVVAVHDPGNEQVDSCSRIRCTLGCVEYKVCISVYLSRSMDASCKVIFFLS